MSDEVGEVLIVDDNPTNIDLLAEMLRRQGFVVRAATSGRRALQTVRTARPQIVLLDIGMPDMDGYVVCRTLKEDAETRDIPVIFVSALDAPLDKVAAFACGGADYVTKPFQFEEVLARIRHQLRIARLREKALLAAAELRAANEELRRAKDEVEAKNRQLEDANARLQALSYRDGLTGIANRRSFEERLAEDWRRHGADGLALVLLDLDHFKRLNDTHGHQHGDDCLVRAARLFEEAVAARGGLAARFGGEEFALLLPNHDLAAATAVAEEICRALRSLRLTHAGSPAGFVTTSAGVAAGSASADALVADADRALYLAKEGGRDRVLSTAAPGA